MKKTIVIQAFASTIADKQDTPRMADASALRAKAAQLKKVGFHKEAKDYEKRAHIVEKRAHKADMDRKFGPMERMKARSKVNNLRECAASVEKLKIPHIAEVHHREEERERLSKVKHHVSKVRPEGPIDNVQFLPKAKRDLVMNDRNAAWSMFQKGFA